MTETADKSVKITLPFVINRMETEPSPSAQYRHIEHIASQIPRIGNKVKGIVSVSVYRHAPDNVSTTHMCHMADLVVRGLAMAGIIDTADCACVRSVSAHQKTAPSVGKKTIIIIKKI